MTDYIRLRFGEMMLYKRGVYPMEQEKDSMMIGGILIGLNFTIQMPKHMLVKSG